MPEKQHDERHRRPEDLMAHAPLRTVIAAQVAAALAHQWDSYLLTGHKVEPGMSMENAAILVASYSVAITDALLARLAETEPEKEGG